MAKIADALAASNGPLTLIGDLSAAERDALAARLKAAGRADRAANVRIGTPPGVDVAAVADGRKGAAAAEKPARHAVPVKSKT